MPLFQECRQLLSSAIETLVATGDLPKEVLSSPIHVEPTKDSSHGDISSNCAMVFAKQAGYNPRALAEKIILPLKNNPFFTRIDIAGPGFINFFIQDNEWLKILPLILDQGTHFGDCVLGQGEKVNIEYVSANPTGPLHVAHARGAVFGDVLANLLQKAGYEVTKEYYINDLGAQIETLSRSVYWHYADLLGHTPGPFPENAYPGPYVRDIAATIIDRDGEKWLHRPESEWLTLLAQEATHQIMTSIRQDLAALGVHQNVFTSERALFDQGKVHHAVEILQQKNMVYRGTLPEPKGKTADAWEPQEMLLFRSTKFGDEVDRPLQRSDGEWTYFGRDIANHWDKVQRDHSHLIVIIGADHGTYAKRIQAAIQVLSDGKAKLEECICQLVRMLDNGQLIRMSKRAGNFVTLRDLVTDVGKDVIRFTMLTRKNDQPLDFDLVKVKEHSKDNPVFYVQYAHARCCSVFRQAAEHYPSLVINDEHLSKASTSLLTDASELGLIKLLAGWPRLVELSARTYEPHRLAYYLYDLASAFHALWNKGRDEPHLRFIRADHPDITMARLLLVRTTQLVLQSGFAVFGIDAVEEMI